MDGDDMVENSVPFNPQDYRREFNQNPTVVQNDWIIVNRTLNGLKNMFFILIVVLLLIGVFFYFKDFSIENIVYANHSIENKVFIEDNTTYVPPQPIINVDVVVFTENKTTMIYHNSSYYQNDTEIYYINNTVVKNVTEGDGNVTE